MSDVEKRFAEFLAENKDREFERCHAWECPLARFYREKEGLPEAVVGGVNFYANENGDPSGRPLKQWEKKFISFVDTSKFPPTGKDCLVYLNSAIGDENGRK